MTHFSTVARVQQIPFTAHVISVLYMITISSGRVSWLIVSCVFPAACAKVCVSEREREREGTDGLDRMLIHLGPNLLICL